MAKTPKKPGASKDDPKRYPSRENTRYIAVPKSLHDVLKTLAEENERSASWMARKYIRMGLKADGKLPPDESTK